MKPILSSAMLLLLAISANAADRFARDPEQISIATTGRIVKVDAKNKTFKIRGSDPQTLSVRNVSQNLSQMVQGLKQRIGVTLPGGITIALPGHGGKSPAKPGADAGNNLEEYTVAITKDTVFQDGGEYIRFEDFRAGETISIHGLLNGNTVTASRIAKWM
ncbi:MAG: hypothetical protein DMG14_02930 [Acidobacteria bacterium]|nr:MAG: hypothetical protein DMG14_02930 [Acidobacteriota bacterium]